MSATRLPWLGPFLADPCHLRHLRAERGSRAGLLGWWVGRTGQEEQIRGREGGQFILREGLADRWRRN